MAFDLDKDDFKEIAAFYDSVFGSVISTVEKRFTSPFDSPDHSYGGLDFSRSWNPVNSSILVEVVIKGESTLNAKPFHNSEAGAINKAEYVVGVFAEDIQSLD